MMSYSIKKEDSLFWKSNRLVENLVTQSDDRFVFEGTNAEDESIESDAHSPDVERLAEPREAMLRDGFGRQKCRRSHAIRYDRVVAVEFIRHAEIGDFYVIVVA